MNDDLELCTREDKDPRNVQFHESYAGFHYFTTRHKATVAGRCGNCGTIAFESTVMRDVRGDVIVDRYYSRCPKCGVGHKHRVTWKLSADCKKWERAEE